MCEYPYYVLIEDLNGFHTNIKIVLPLFCCCIVPLLLLWFCLSAVRLSLRSVFATAVAPAAPVAVFQTASFCAQASHLRALDPPRIGSRELGRYSEPLGGLWETLGDFRSIWGSSWRAPAEVGRLW